MRTIRNSHSEEQVMSLLLAHDEAKDANRTTANGNDSAAATDPEALAEFLELQSIVDLLARASRHTLPPGCSTDDLSEPCASTDDLPSKIGHFRVKRELGRGGCGIAFLATDEVLDRDVALKVPRPEALVSRELRKRFVLEAKAAALVDHPNIVPIYEVSEGDPLCYIASAYCQGPTLAAWFQDSDEPLCVRVVVRLIADLADAVQHAHSRGIVHRDIKPGNVLLEPKQSSISKAVSSEREQFAFTPRLTDFGLAKLLDSDASATRTGALMGTPSYMAPEQAEGRLDDVGPHTDVYALGAVLYELLTGVPPFQGRNDADTLRRIVADDLISPRRLRPVISRDLSAICLKCLERKPQDRYESARALADDLQRFLEGKTTIARPVSMLRRGLRWARRRPVTAALVAVILFAASIIGVGGWWSSVRYQRALDSVQRHLYVSDIRLAHQAWERGDTPEMVDLLARHVPSNGEVDRRSFPWHYLWRLCHSELKVCDGHDGEVMGLDFTPDGQTMCTVDSEGIARLWDVATGLFKKSLKQHPDQVNFIRFSPDGELLATACEDGQVRLWSVSSGELKYTFDAHPGGALGVDFGPQGRLLATCGRDNQAVVWDIESGKRVFALQGHEEWVETVCFSPAGTTLATGGHDGTAKLWDVSSRQFLMNFPGSNSRVIVLAYSPDGSRLATAGIRDAELHIWEVKSGRLLMTLEVDKVRVRSVAWSPDGNRIVAAGDSETRVWNIKEPHPLGTRRGLAGRVRMVRFSSDGKLLATAGRDGTVRLWDAFIDLEGRELHYETEFQNGIQCIAISPDSHTVATVCETNCILLNQIENGRILQDPEAVSRIYTKTAHPLTDVTFSPDGRKTVWGSSDGWVGVCDVKSFKHEFSAHDHDQAVRCLAISPDGRFLVSGGREGKVIVRDWMHPAKKRFSIDCDAEVLHVAFSQDSKQLAISSGPLVTLWNPEDWSNKATLQHPRLIRWAEFSPDKRLLATAGDDKVVSVWDAATHTLLFELAGHSDRIRSASFSKDGRTLASADQDGTIRLWNLNSGLQTFALSGSRHPLVSFLPDGSGLMATATGADGRTRIRLFSTRPTQGTENSHPQVVASGR